MRISLRLIVWLIIGVGLAAFLFAYYQVRVARRSLRGELQRHASLLAEGLGEALVPGLDSGSSKDLRQVVERFGNRERLAGIAVFDSRGLPLAVTSGLDARLANMSRVVPQVLASKAPHG